MNKTLTLIAGGSGGIGNAIADAFAAHGHQLWCIDKVPPKTPNMDYIACDFGDMQAVEQGGALQQQLAKITGSDDFSKINFIFCAAQQHIDSVLASNRQNYMRSFDTNFYAFVYMTRLLLPPMLAIKNTSGGSIIGLSSIHAKLSKSGFALYAASKAALSAYLRGVVLEFGTRITANSISPAAIDTPMLRAGFADNPTKLDALGGFHPAGRIGTPEELAELVLFLTSGKADFINGADIEIGGGIFARLHDPD